MTNTPETPQTIQARALANKDEWCFYYTLTELSQTAFHVMWSRGKFYVRRVEQCTVIVGAHVVHRRIEYTADHSNFNVAMDTARKS